jgi:glycosyltransferase involved in cell wall biosynthesis
MPKNKSPRVHWYSNHPDMPTGYGTQSAQVLRRMRKRGHSLTIQANYGHMGSVGKWESSRVFPVGYETWSHDIMFQHYREVRRESSDPIPFFTLADVWVFRGKAWDDIDQIVSWVPIDHAGIPPQVEPWLKRENVLPIAMSKHGAEAMRIRDIEHVYIPHALEKHWVPTVMENDPWPGRFVVTIPNANKGVLPSRKAWGENLLAFGVFAKSRPDALLYLHTDATGSGAGIDLLSLIDACGIDHNQVVFVDQYEHRMGVADEVMAAIYTRTDVLLSATAGEGFGLPVLEAQACGTPVIVSNFSAQPELVGDGWVCEVQPQWNPTQLQWFATPLVHSIVRALEEAYERPRGQVSDEAVEFAQDYAADKVFAEGWVPLLDMLA